jgi:RNA polymerase sigma-70 factor (ECF subfamily)
VATEATQTQAIARAEADTDLARRLMQADPAAYGELSSRFGPALHAFAASRLGGDHDRAEDAMVHTLVDAVRNIRRFNPRRSTLSAWLYGIARRQVQAERRTQRRKKSLPRSAQVPMEAIPDLPATGDMAADLTDRMAARQTIAQLAGVLSDLEMEVLMLRCVGEFSLKQIGRMVGRSERAVHSLLHRAKQRAREGLREHAD